MFLLLGIFALVFFFNSCSCDQWFNNGCEFQDTWIGGIVHAAEPTAAEKETERRCAFAVTAALIPPAIPLTVVCEKPFQMIEGDDVLTLNCKKYCKARGLK